jgi:signal transduction histidine kinase/CheY-like chemotaxis protein
MWWLRSALRSDPETKELLLSTSRTLILMTGGFYLMWHFIATLGWPKLFSSSLWVTSALMLVVVAAALFLVGRSYILAQFVWLVGLAGVIFQAYGAYRQPEIILLLALLPLMAVTTTGRSGAVMLTAGLLGFLLLQPQLNLLPDLPQGYIPVIILSCIFTGFLGWTLSSNLLEAISVSTYHYKEARRLLEETRLHRGQISRMLKEQGQANYQLERLNQMLTYTRLRAEEAREDRDRFILAVSHELRSPLNFIIGFSDLMVNSPETYANPGEWPAGLYDDVREIYRSSTHLLGLINDILDLGQMDAHHMTMYREQVSPGELLIEVQQMVAQAFLQKGLDLHLEIEPELPQIFVDCTRIRQVLLNLANNGLRFTARGSVTLGIRRQKHEVLVWVRDTGAGIAPEDIPKVFDEFRQVGQENWRRREGTGLGLAISKRFILAHGGHMWLESTLGQGTTFYFTLPAAGDPALDYPPPGHQTLPAYTSDSFLSPARNQPRPVILLVTKNQTAAQFIERCLDEYQVVTMENVQEAARQVRRVFPRAILFDQETTAPEQFERHALPYELPLIQISLPFPHGQDASLPEEISDYLVKPVTRQRLLEAIAHFAPQAKNFLIVDDDPAMLRFVTQALRNDGAPSHPRDYRLVTATSGQEALQIQELAGMDAVLLDLDLPDLSGWQVLARLKSQPETARIPVIIISASDPPPLLFPSGKAVFAVIRSRPFSQPELAQTLKPLLSAVQPVYPRQMPRPQPDAPGASELP